MEIERGAEAIFIKTELSLWIGSAKFQGRIRHASDGLTGAIFGSMKDPAKSLRKIHGPTSR
jgi:hypothetical protein